MAIKYSPAKPEKTESAADKKAASQKNTPKKNTASDKSDAAAK